MDVVNLNSSPPTVILQRIYDISQIQKSKEISKYF